MKKLALAIIALVALALVIAAASCRKSKSNPTPADYVCACVIKWDNGNTPTEENFNYNNVLKNTAVSKCDSQLVRLKGAYGPSASGGNGVTCQLK